MKLGHGLLTKKDALWVQVLRAKYKLKDQIPQTIVRS